MDEKKLIIRPVKNSGGTTAISFSISKDLLAAVDSVANKTGRNRSQLGTVTK